VVISEPSFREFCCSVFVFVGKCADFIELLFQMVVLEGGGMLTTGSNQYLQPDYLSPLPTTVSGNLYSINNHNL
jgi:hypothetical protein